MKVEEKLKELIIEKYGSVLEFSKASKISNSTIATIMKRGVNNSSINNIIKICQTLGISADALSKGKIVPIPQDNEVKDIFESLYYYKMNISQFENYTIHGMPLTQEDAEFLLDSVEMTLETIKKKKLREINRKKGDSNE